MSINKASQERLAALKEQLANSHSGNPLILDGAVELDQYTLAETNWGRYVPDMDKFAYARIGKDHMSGQAVLFWDGTGVFWSLTYENIGKRPDTSDPRVNRLGRMKVRFWAFGCKHQYKELGDSEARERGIGLGRCEHASVCAVCGHVHVVDSSD